MRIADKLFTSLVQRQAQSPKARGEEQTQKPKAETKGRANQAQEAFDRKPASELSDAARETADKLVRLGQKEDGAFDDELAKQLDQMNPGERMAVLSELRNREESLETVRRTNDMLVSKNFVDFLA